MPHKKIAEFKELDKKIRALHGEIDSSRVRMAHLLFVMTSGEGPQRLGFGTQEAYFESVGLKARTAYWLIRIHVSCVKAGITMEEAIRRAGGISKLGHVASSLTQENAETVLDGARLQTFAQLSQSHPDPQGELERRSFALSQDAWRVVDIILDAIQEQCDSPQTRSRLLELWAAEKMTELHKRNLSGADLVARVGMEKKPTG